MNTCTIKVKIILGAYTKSPPWPVLGLGKRKTTRGIYWCSDTVWIIHHNLHLRLISEAKLRTLLLETKHGALQ